MLKACHVRMSYLDVFFQIVRMVGQSWWGGTSGASPSWVPDPHASFIWTNVIVVASGKTHKCYLCIKEKNSQEKILEQLLIHATFQLDCQDCLAGIITFKFSSCIYFFIWTNVIFISRRKTLKKEYLRDFPYLPHFNLNDNIVRPVS